MSGTSTPLSTSSTVISSPLLKPTLPLNEAFGHNRISASTAIEYLASRPETSSSVYVYDVAEQVGFGTLTKEWANASAHQTTAPIIDLQTRAGAGLGLVGRLSEGSSRDSVGSGAVVTAYTTPSGLALMAPAMAYLPPASAQSRLVVQVPAVTATGDNFTLSPSLASLASAIPGLPSSVVVLASGSAQEAVDFAAISYHLPAAHVVHIFDHFSATREIGAAISAPAATRDFSSVSDALGEFGHEFFTYVGDKEATTVVVAINGPLALAAQTLARRVPGFGVLAVKVLRPWDEKALLGALPATARHVHVLDDVPNAATRGCLFDDVLGTLSGSGQIAVHPQRIVPSRTQEFVSQQDALTKFLASLAPTAISVEASKAKKLLVFSTPQSTLAAAPHFFAETFLANAAISTRFLVDHDVFSCKGGITVSRLSLAPADSEGQTPVALALPLDVESTGEADFLSILDHSLLTSHSLVKYAKAGSAVLLVSSWGQDEVIANLPSDAVAVLISRSIRLFVIDPKSIAANLNVTGEVGDAIENLVAHLAFLRLYFGQSATESKILAIARWRFDPEVRGISLSDVNARAWSALFEVGLQADGVASSSSSSSTLKEVEINAIAVQTEAGDVVNGAKLSSWHDAAKHLLFPAAFQLASATDSFEQNPALRPELPERTFLVTCTVNRRLTAKDYDRNVFHLEFDTSGTGLKYAIGEALGVHGWNDESEVLAFCASYGVDPGRLVTIPVLGREDEMHTRTVFQALQQQIDLFGRPPKSFFTDLAAYATNSVDRHALLFIGAPEGAATFKKLSETDTVTFADVLGMYPSARPGIERLCELVGDINPRHYSIASAQSVVGDRVDLLVVTVEWANPSGSPRYGQCTRYLAGLKLGQKVTVSIKPSVMKLPPSNLQPLIMAGLGTGAAPFRAFLQHRAMLQKQGEAVGPVYYYFGSRYQSQEYLYGEEIEAFVLDNVITRAGLAFSRDGPNKVYIQHKMLEDSKALADMMLDQQGVFYLCGPTWPVPDVYEALVDALVTYKGQTAEAAGEYIESLKEEERYVLEVY